MSIIITSGSISFDGIQLSQPDVSASLQLERKRKSDDGIPMKRLRAFNSASTFIDFNTSKKGARPGQAIDIYVRDTYEAFHISPDKISMGPKPTVPLELTGSITTWTAGQEESSSFLDNNSFTFPSGSDSGSYGLIIDNGMLSWGVLTVDNAACMAPGTSLINGALGAVGGIGNSQIINQDTVVQGCMVTIMYVTANNDSITINPGINYTISQCADVTIVQSDQTFTGGSVGTLESTGLVAADGGTGNTQVISNDVTLPPFSNMVLYVNQYDDGITINQGINYTISQAANLTIMIP